MLYGKKSSSKSGLLPEDRQFLESILGKEQVDKLEAEAGSRGKALEDAGINFKAGDQGTGPSSELALVISAQAKIFGDVLETMQATAEAVKEASNFVNATDDRLSQIESKLQRNNLLLMAMLAPQHASKSIFTQLTPEEAAQLAKMQQVDESQQDKDKKRKKSYLEQIAEQAGAASGD